MASLIRSVVSLLATTPARWAALAGVEPELVSRRPASGEWSAVECLGHVVDTEAHVFLSRVNAIREGRAFAAFDPDAEGGAPGRTMAALASELTTQRAVSLEVLATLTDADLERSAHHAELGEVTLRELLNEWAAHDTMHLVQAERALMQPFITECGPWRPYFAGHDVAGAPAG